VRTNITPLKKHLIPKKPLKTFKTLKTCLLHLQLGEDLQNSSEYSAWYQNWEYYSASRQAAEAALAAAGEGTGMGGDAQLTHAAESTPCQVCRLGGGAALLRPPQLVLFCLCLRLACVMPSCALFCCDCA
jgi:hypothetical protein